MPAFPYNTEGRSTGGGREAAGAASFSHTHAPQFGALQRPAGVHSHAINCVGFRLPDQRQGGQPQHGDPVALATGHCEVRTGWVAAEIIVDDHGRATGVRYFDAAGRSHEQTADVVVVSASATETARLLLNSSRNCFPTAPATTTIGWGETCKGTPTRAPTG